MTIAGRAGREMKVKVDAEMCVLREYLLRRFLSID